MKKKDRKRTPYVDFLPDEVQAEIVQALTCKGVYGERLSRALRSRLGDLGEIIEIGAWL